MLKQLEDEIDRWQQHFAAAALSASSIHAIFCDRPMRVVSLTVRCIRSAQAGTLGDDLRYSLRAQLMGLTLRRGRLERNGLYVSIGGHSKCILMLGVMARFTFSDKSR